MSNFGKEPELARLPVEKLGVDRTYQRTLDTKAGKILIARIAARFRWSAFQAILATPDGKGGWLIIDGQHRVAAARQLGIKRVPAVIVDAVSVAEQAAAFVEANQARVSINPFALFHARLAAGEEEAGELQRLCEKAGITIPRYPLPADKIKPGETLALGTLAKIARAHPPAFALLVFKAVGDAYRGTAGGLAASFFAGAALALDGVEPIQRAEAAARITQFLKTKTPTDIAIAAQRRKESYGATLAKNLADILKQRLQLAKARAAEDAPADESFIKRPSRAQLMGGR
jgi:hypothetical protein